MYRYFGKFHLKFIGRNWAFADSIEVLCSSWDLAQDINGKRRSEAGKLISTLEAKHNFSVNLQMADNFMCRGVSCICILRDGEDRRSMI